MVVAFVSSDGSIDGGDISDYCRLEPAGSAQPRARRRRRAGVRLAVRDADLARSGQAGDLSPDARRRHAAIQAQNAQVSAGQLGAAPAVPGQQLNATITAQSRLQTPEEFGAILLRSEPATARRCGCATSRASSWASENYDIESATTASRRRAWRSSSPPAPMRSTPPTRPRALDELQSRFPPGVQAVTRSTPRRSCSISIEEVVKTLVEAIVLVFLVMFVFLQNVRATLIPTLAVPVVLLGTFGVLAVFGFTINTLTMFGVVLAIGLLVDDAIVVVENVERVMHEEGLSPIEAARRKRWIRSPARWSASRWCSPRCSCRWLLRRLGRRHLPPVLDHHRLVDGAVGRRRAGADARAVRDDPQTAKGARLQAPRVLRLVQPVFDRTSHGYESVVRRLTRRTLPAMAVYRGAGGAMAAALRCECRPRSCPTRTRACSTRWRSCQPARPSRRPSRS